MRWESVRWEGEESGVRWDGETARRRFATARVARLATVDPEGRPHLVPVTFALRDDVVVTAVDAKPKTTTHLRRLRNIAAHPEVCLLVDAYDEDWNRLWWVRADGRAEVLTKGSAWGDAIAWLVAKYDQYAETPPTGPVIRIEVTCWSGWAAGPT